MDLYLAHFPDEVIRNNASRPRDRKIRETTWADLEGIYNRGDVKAIGVCDFKIQQLEDLAQNQRVRPAVNQVRIPIIGPVVLFVCFFRHLHHHHTQADFTHFWV